jgi:hypothetical protein
MPQRGERSILWTIIALIVLAGVKLWLVHRHEIAACDYPFDDPWYVIASLHGYWRGSYAEAGFIRPPGYPLWIAASRFLGIPLRISTELLLLASAATFALTLRSIGLSRVAVVAVFGLVAFHPLGVFVNDAVLTESLYGPLSFLAAAAMIGLLAQPADRFLMMALGALLAALWHTRHESQLLVAYLVLFAVLLALARRRQGSIPRLIARELMIVLLTVGSIIAAATVAVRGLNQQAFGAFADHQLAMAEYQSLTAGLLRIRPETDACTVPISRVALRQAFAASATFRLLQPYFDGPEGQRWADLSVQLEADQREIAGGTMPWALLAAFRWAGQGSTAEATRTFCRQAAAEIDAACASGTLHCTSALRGSLLRLGNCFSHFPGSSAREAAVFWWTGSELSPHCSPTATDPHTVDLFDVALNRRRALVTETVHLTGWIIDPRDPVRSVSFRSAAGRTVPLTDDIRTRPDLDAAFKDDVASDSEAARGAFDFTIALPREELERGALVVARRSGAAVTLPYSDVATVPLRYRRKASEDSTLEYAIEGRQLQEPADLGAGRGLTLLLQTYGYIVIGFGLGAVLALVSLGFRIKRIGAPVLLWNAAWLLLGLIAIRYVTFTVVDILMWPAPDPRYLYPIAPLLPCACLLLIFCAMGGGHQSRGSTAAADNDPAAKR